MPTVNVSADLIKHMRRQIDLIRRMHAGRKMKYVCLLYTSLQEPIG